MRDIVDRKTSEYRKVESMIPILTEDGFVCNRMAENRAIRNGILSNSLSSNQELIGLMSLTNRVLEIQNNDLEQLIYDKLEYYGFVAKNIPIKVDMSLHEKIICFSCNFMFYHDYGNKEKFMKILNHLKTNNIIQKE